MAAYIDTSKDTYYALFGVRRKITSRCEIKNIRKQSNDKMEKAITYPSLNTNTHSNHSQILKFDVKSLPSTSFGTPLCDNEASKVVVVEFSSVKNECQVTALEDNEKILLNLPPSSFGHAVRNNETSINNDENPEKNECIATVLGSNGTRVRTELLKFLQWEQENYSKSVRILLREFFSKQELATHSFSGKSSPAFPGKVAKPPLDRKITDDIVHYATGKGKIHGLTATQIKKAITSACADEAKPPKRKSVHQI